MNAYVYQSALWCPDCIRDIKKRLKAKGKEPESPDDERTYDSDDYPKGPYSQGGGEADTPNHCDGCKVFLENPLTSDGEAAVRAAGRDPKNAKNPVVKEWKEYYDYLDYGDEA